MRISVIILAYNEELHIERCIKSVKLLTESIYVVDSHSSDNTKIIAKRLGARCLSREFDSHARQFNWAVTQIEECDWVIRVDSDEYLTSELISSIKNNVMVDQHNVNGFSFRRRAYFLGRPIVYGGVFPIEVVRMFRYGMGLMEDRLMDEHILINGDVGVLSGEIIDDNLRSISWWTNKHNRYASLEALEMYFENRALISEPKFSKATAGRRKLKAGYQSMPIPIRATLFFVYRFVFRLGFLDGFFGFLFHFYQGYWYRSLVDTKYRLLVDACIKSENKFLENEDISRILDLPTKIIATKTESS